MKTLKNILATLTLITIAAVSVNAQNTATVNDAVANATIVTPITLENTLSFELGELVKPSTGDGTLSISASDSPTRNFGGGLTAIPGDTWRPATFTVSADDNFSFSITKPATITMDGPSSSSFDITTSISGEVANVTTSGGAYVFYIGGSATIPSTQTAGVYQGTYEVTVTYE